MANIDEDLSQLERDIRQLKIEYDQYFGGGRPRPPADTQWRADQMIKRYADRGGQMSFAQRFRYNNLAQTYAKYQDMWRKRVKQKEEGTVQRHFGAAARAIEAEREKAAAGLIEDVSADEATGPAVRDAQFVVSCSDPDREIDKVEQLYRALVEAKQKAGEETDALHLDHFTDFIRMKTQQLKRQKGCEEVEYTVTVEQGHVRLKARVKT